MKLWAKIIEGEKIIANKIYRNSQPLTQATYEAFLVQIAEDLDLSTPVGLSVHFTHLAKFNIVEYKPRDFMEPVTLTKFVIENVDY